MKYMLMLWGDEAALYQQSDAEAQADMERHDAFARLLAERGIAHSGEALQSSTTATTLRQGGGDTVITDGPYAELKEQIGGFYIIEARDLDEALELAKRCPNYGGIEIRPIMELADLR